MPSAPAPPNAASNAKKEKVVVLVLFLCRCRHHIHNRTKCCHPDANPPPRVGIVWLSWAQDRVGVLFEWLEFLARRVFHVAPDSALARGLGTSSASSGRVQGLCWQHLRRVVDEEHGDLRRPVESEEIEPLDVVVWVVESLVGLFTVSSTFNAFLESQCLSRTLISSGWSYLVYTASSYEQGLETNWRPSTAIG